MHYSMKIREPDTLCKWLAAFDPQHLRRALWVLAMLFVWTAASARPAHALESIVLGSDREVVDITMQGEQYEPRGDKLSIETAPSADGVTGRMTVSAKTSGTSPSWVVFALNNPTDKQVRRLLVAQRYDLVGSKVFLPNLDAPRVANITPSLGFRPEKSDNDAADVYALTLEPGATVTFIVELSSADFPRLTLIGGAAWGQKARDGTLFNGILLGISGLLALFPHRHLRRQPQGSIFPATAIVAWSVVAYLCVDFGFWHKLFKLPAEDNAIYRAASEAPWRPASSCSSTPSSHPPLASAGSPCCSWAGSPPQFCLMALSRRRRQTGVRTGPAFVCPDRRHRQRADRLSGPARTGARPVPAAHLDAVPGLAVRRRRDHSWARCPAISWSPLPECRAGAVCRAARVSP